MWSDEVGGMWSDEEEGMVTEKGEMVWTEEGEMVWTEEGEMVWMRGRLCGLRRDCRLRRGRVSRLVCVLRLG